MPNKYNFPISPIRRRSSKLSPAPKGNFYFERMLHTGIISTVSSTTEFVSLGSNIPSNVPEGVDLNIPLEVDAPHVNPKGLNYVVRVIYNQSSSHTTKYYKLASAVNNGMNTEVVLDSGDLTTDMEGGRFEILMPIDDGIRYLGVVSSYVGSTITFSPGRVIDELQYVAVDGTFDAVLLRSDGSYESKKIIGLTYTDVLSPVEVDVISPFSTYPEEGDLVVIKSRLWSSFCNPMPDSGAPLNTDLYDTSNPLFKYAPMFDYEIDHASGSFQWFGNWVYGIANSSSIQLGPDFSINGGSVNFDLSLAVKNSTAGPEPVYYNIGLDASVKNSSPGGVDDGSFKINCVGTTGPYTYTLDSNPSVSGNQGEDVIFDNLSAGQHVLRIQDSTVDEDFEIVVDVSEGTSGSALIFLGTHYSFLSQSYTTFSIPLSFTKGGVYHASPAPEDGIITISPVGAGGPFTFTLGGDTYSVSSGGVVTFSGLSGQDFHPISFLETVTGATGVINVYLERGDIVGSYIEDDAQFNLVNNLYFQGVSSSVLSAESTVAYTGSQGSSGVYEDDSQFFTTSLPNIPYNVKLNASGVALGTSNFITEEDAHVLTEGSLDATPLHMHDIAYFRKSELTDSGGGGNVHWDNITDKDVYTTAEVYNKSEVYTKAELNTSNGGGAVHWDNVTNVPSLNQVEWRTTPLVKTLADFNVYGVIENNWRAVPRSFFEAPLGKIPVVRIIAYTSTSTSEPSSATSYIGLRGNSQGTATTLAIEERIHWDENQGYSKSAPSVSQQVLIPTYGSPQEDYLFSLYASDLWFIVLGYTS